METNNTQVCKTSLEICNRDNVMNLSSIVIDDADDDDKSYSKQCNDTEVQIQQYREQGHLQEISNCQDIVSSDGTIAVGAVVTNDSLQGELKQNDRMNRIRNNTNNNNDHNKFQFRAPQQFIHKKSSWKRSWKKQSKCRQKHNHHNQQSTQDCTIENGTQQQQQQQPQQNLKNHNHNHHHQHHHPINNHHNRKIQQQQQQQQQKNNGKQQLHNHNEKKMFIKRMPQPPPSFTSLRSKFFLPQKRPRKEIIIPPTKFLLGGNISDPLNLNSLQDEASNSTTPNATPKQSPITTPPKVEVIIPPNIHDPLHLLDPVDSMEYEKQLVSPMKRKSKSKHRHRKKRPKHNQSIGLDITVSSSSSNAPMIPSVTTTIASTMTVNVSKNISVENAIQCSEISGSGGDDLIKTKTDGESNDVSGTESTQVANEERSEQVTTGGKKEGEEFGKRSNERERATKELKLNLALANAHQQQQNQLHSANNNSGSGSGRKRKSSEGPNSGKNKLRRLDSLDKIVSPVVPQPGAWKRPPRTVPSGGRKNSRVRSTSASENELISPTEEVKTIESESTRDDTPDIENSKQGDILSTSFNQNEMQDKQQLEQQPTELIAADNSVPKKFKPDGAKYQYGNYDNYAEYRRNLTEFVDVRLQVFKRHYDLFKGKDILDIGCNVGHMTIAVAQKLAPKSILGIDIDSTLIAKARKNMSLYVRIPKEHEEKVKDHNQSENPSSTGKKKKKSSKRKKFYSKLRFEISRNELFPISFPICYGSIPNLSPTHQSGNVAAAGSSGSGNKDETSATITKPRSFKNEFPKNVFFRVTNYVLPDESLLSNDTQQYDLILCLSVTKWIHLNFGDAGLKLAFKRMFNQLRPGGKLILEAQNWASYKKRKNLTETIYNNYKNIEFFPDDFHEYLLSNEVGFSHAYTLDVPRHKSKGFSRPIQLYAKGDFTPSHIRWSDNYHPQITPYEAYRGIYAAVPRAPQHPPWNYDTPHGNSGNYSCRQTPMYQPTSQYYNPLETDTYLPSYDTEVLNRHYVFASPLYQTVWSPPASLRNSSSHTPLYGSVRDSDIDDATNNGTSRHVYPPSNDDASSPHTTSGSAFNSIHEADSDETAYNSRQHVYAVGPTNYENTNSSLSPHVIDNHSHHHHNSDQIHSVASSVALVDVVDCANTATASVSSSGLLDQQDSSN